jgi:phosphatidyl-myo-inositol alpha-mannosyltransferase
LLAHAQHSDRREFETRPAPRLSIAVLSYGLPTVGQKRGGIERVAHEIADGLARRGHAVTVFSHDEAPAGARYAVEPLPWRRMVNTWLGRRLTMGYLGNILMAIPRTDRFDAVIAHGDSLLARFRRTPLVRVMHGSAWDEARTATSIGRLLLQTGVYVQELLTAAVTPATVGVSLNTRRSNPFVRQVVPNGVNREVFRPDERDRASVPTLVFVGALTGRKRGGWLLDLFSDVLRPARPDLELHMVCAAGPARAGVTYHSGISDVALATLYRRAWLYVSPSTYEGFGLPYVEALASGTSVVATPNPGSTEVLAGGGGILCNDSQFGQTVLALLGDEVRRARLMDEGLAVAERYDLARTLDAYETLLRQLSDSSTRTRTHG